MPIITGRKSPPFLHNCALVLHKKARMMSRGSQRIQWSACECDNVTLSEAAIRRVWQRSILFVFYSTNRLILNFRTHMWHYPQKNLNWNMIYNSKLPKIVQYTIKFSGGRIKNESQAHYVLLCFVVVSCIISLYSIFGSGDRIEQPYGGGSNPEFTLPTK